jgi:arsenate reductase
MKKVSIYHNNRCSKSRQALAILQDRNVDVDIVEYLKEPFSISTLKRLVNRLGVRPIDIMRKGEQDFKAHIKGKDLTDDELFAFMVKYPKLIERPILVSGDKVIVARPPELVNDFISAL